MIIETDKVYLRPVTENDVNDIYEYAKDPETGPRAGWPPHENIETTKKIVSNWVSPNCSEMVLAIVFKKNNKVIGTIGITPLNSHIKDDKNTIAKNILLEGKIAFEIGTTVSKEYWNKGISSALLQNIISYLFNNKNADTIIACHYQANLASARVQEKNNMKILGTYQRDKAWYNTDCKTMVVRAITKQEWIAKNNNLYIQKNKEN